MKTVMLCNGKRCRQRLEAKFDLDDTLEGIAEIEIVGCQKICMPPVVGVEIDGRLEWFAPVNSAKSRRRLRQLLAGKRMRNALAKRRIAARSGKRR